MISPGRYDAAIHRRWVAALGRLHAPDGPAGEHRLDGNHLDARWPVGCYVAVDTEGRVLYVGQVRRTSGGFAERLANHHQLIEDWHRIWLLPMRRDIAAPLVSLIEAMLIWTLRPEHNRLYPSLALHVAAPI